MRQSPSVKSGFTLVELIAVIVVVTLSVILVIASSRISYHSHADHRRAHCASNLRQIGLAIEQYTMDFGQGYPKAAGPGNVGIGASSLALLARPYPKADKLAGVIKFLKIFICPLSNDTYDEFTDTWMDFSSAKSISYGYDPGHSSGDSTDVAISADYSPDGNNSENHPTHPNDAPNGGQNVLFLGDWHWEWRETPNCGVDDNNIYQDDAPNLPRAQDSIIVR